MDVHTTQSLLLSANSKMCDYILFRLDMTARQSAEVIMQETIQLCVVPSAIGADCRLLFIFRLCANLMYSFQIERRLNIAFHPWTNRQTASQHSVLEQYLRSYFNYQEDHLAPLLALAKFAHNASVHTSACRLLFEIVY